MGLRGGRAAREELQELRSRVESIEGSIAELRRHHLRLAELTDLVQELLVPLASRDEEKVTAAIDKFQQGL
ncbi:DUF6752 domain-containing protein [Nocardioides sp. LML1-1-1.1]|uniref:DUF6752 domain-containing protein n=1 Tax=Nocardioides sp. LML1-1-1.1 TaxID=3135248 RepID=UPI003429AD60